MKPAPQASQRGVAALEAALVLGPAMLIFAFIASFGFLFLLKQDLAHAAGEGARALVYATLRNEGDAAPRACEAVWAALADTTRWLDGGGPLCSVGPACGYTDGQPCRVRIAVGYPADGGSGLYAALNLFGTFTAASDDTRHLSRLLGSQVTAQVMAPVAAFSGTAP